MSRYSEVDADQVEGVAIRIGAAVPLVEGLRDDLVSDALLEDDPAALETIGYDVARVDKQLESRVGAVATEIAKRTQRLGSAYPFDFDTARQSLKYRKSKTRVYEFCLAISLARNIQVLPFANLPRIFERLTGRVVSAFLGGDASWYRAGWPPEGDRPTSFKEVMAELNTRTNEWHWRPRPDLNLPSEGPPNVKDGGIDLVVWKYPPDGRVGGITLLGQCACGDDWSIKTSDLDPNKLDIYVPRPTVAKEIRFFSMPRLFPEEQWIPKSHQAGIIFDRVRLVLLAELNLDAAATAELVDESVALVLSDYKPSPNKRAVERPRRRDTPP